MEVLYRRCCGLDVHKEAVVACLRIVSDGKVDSGNGGDRWTSRHSRVNCGGWQT
jgi:hypothetical protein